MIDIDLDLVERKVFRRVVEVECEVLGGRAYFIIGGV